MTPAPDNRKKHTSTKTIGLIGIGLLGSALAERWLTAGFRVLGFDTDARRRDEFEKMGGTWCSRSAEVATSVSRLVTSLPDSRIVGQLVEDLGDALEHVDLLIDTTTGAPTDVAKLAQRLATWEVSLVDATVAGSSAQARRGQVLIMAGGRTEDYQRCHDVLGALSEQVMHVGPVGAGAKMKLVVNLAIGLHRAVLAEAMALGAALGLEATDVLQVLRAGPSHSRMMDTKGDKMLHRDFTPQARLRQHLKDVDLMLDEAKGSDFELALTRVHAELLRELVARGYGDEDNSAILRAYFADE